MISLAKPNLLKGKVYAVGPAHVLFCPEANEKYQTERCDISSIRETIESSHQNYAVTIKLPVFQENAEPTENEPEPVPTYHPLLLAYRYRYSETEEQAEEFQLFMNDLVLFQIDRVKAKALQKDLKSYNISRHDQMKSLSIDELQQLHNKRQKVAVRNLKGRLHPYDLAKDIKDNKGLRLLFVLDKDDSCREDL